MIRDLIGMRYAEAIYEIAEEKKMINELYKDLEMVLEYYENNKEFKSLINHPVLSKKDKKEIFEKCFKLNINSFSIEVLNFIIDKDRLLYLKSMVKEYLKLYYYKQNIVEVHATFTIMPNDKQKDKLISKIEKMTNKKVKLFIDLDKEIIGGGVLKIGDTIIDGSLKRQFEMLKSNL